MNEHQRWFLDCYSSNALCGEHFPVNSFGPMSWGDAARMKRDILSNPLTGIDHAEIVTESKGQNIRGAGT